MATFKKELPCQLTHEEKETHGDEMASLVIKIVNKEEEKKEIVGKLTKELKQMGAEVRKLARAVNSGEELRMVDCEEVQNHDDNSVDTIRLDVGEVVNKRPMDDQDRQGQLDTLTENTLDGIERATEEAEEGQAEDPLPGGPDDNDDPDAALPGGESLPQ